MGYRLAALIIFATMVMACNKSPLAPETIQSGPTPAGDPAATASLRLYFIRVCAANEFPPQTPAGQVPVCVRGTSDTYGLIVTSTDNDLKHAIQLERALQGDESWSGALLCIQEHTGVGGRTCSNDPFVPGSTDRFVFTSLRLNQAQVGNEVQISVEFRPGPPAGRFPLLKTRFNPAYMQTPGYNNVYRAAYPPEFPEFRVIGPKPGAGSARMQPLLPEAPVDAKPFQAEAPWDGKR